MKAINTILIIALMFVMCVSGFADETRITDGFTWMAITDPGGMVVDEPTLSNPPDFVLEPADTPSAPLGTISESGMTGMGRLELQERILTKMEEKYPPVLLLNITVPPSARTSEMTYIEIDLPYDEPVDVTKCVQLIPLFRDAHTPTMSSTIQGAMEDLDFEHTMTATPGPDGKFRFDFTEAVRLISEGRIGNRFILRPFKSRDKFEIESISSSNFAIILMHDIVE